MDSSTEDSDAYIPGLSKPGNRRHPLKGRKTPEVKANVSLDKPADEIVPPVQKLLVHNLTQSLDSHNKRRHMRSASFKDLRMEDKKRVANLIKELAKAGDEKERVVSQLHEERVQYEQQILQLVAQQEEVLKEREDIQLKLFETQQLLSRYQEQMVEEENAARGQTKDGLKMMIQPAERERPAPKFGQPDCEVHPLEDAERPYTSLIDREIAMQRQNDQYSQPVMEDLGRVLVSGKDREDQYKLGLQKHFNKFPDSTVYGVRESGDNGQVGNGTKSHGKGKSSRKHLGPLREPIMSSTQKSSQIIEDMSFTSLPTIASDNFQVIPPDASPRTTLGFSNINGHNSDVSGRSGRSRVGFLECPEDLDSARVHSTVLESNTEPMENRQFMEYYKKLTPAERKQELLHQRATLLEEQNRLKQILIEQEVQLKEKQKQLEQKKQQKILDYVDPVTDIDVRLHKVQAVYGNQHDNQQVVYGDQHSIQQALYGNQRSNQQAVYGNQRSSQQAVYDDQHNEQVAYGDQHNNQQIGYADQHSHQQMGYGDQHKNQRVGYGDQHSHQQVGYGDQHKHQRVGYGDQHSHQQRQAGKTRDDMEVVVKRLDYSSLSSRSNSDASSCRSHRKKKHVKSAGTSPMTLPTCTSIGTSPLRLDRDLSDMPDLIDAGTSVSYRHIARSPQQSTLPSHANHPRASPYQRSAKSPGDKTLAILDIVNSLERLDSSLNESDHIPYDDYVGTMLQNSSREQSLSEKRDQEEDFEESKILEEVFFLK